VILWQSYLYAWDSCYDITSMYVCMLCLYACMHACMYVCMSWKPHFDFGQAISDDCLFTIQVTLYIVYKLYTMYTTRVMKLLSVIMQSSNLAVPLAAKQGIYIHTYVHIYIHLHMYDLSAYIDMCTHHMSHVMIYRC